MAFPIYRKSFVSPRTAQGCSSNLGILVFVVDVVDFLSMTSYIGHAANATTPEAMSHRIAFPSIRIGLGNGLALGLLYLCVQRLLRYQRENRLLKRYRQEASVQQAEHPLSSGGSQNPEDGRLGLDLGKMTFTQASKIQKELAQLEFPYTFGHSLELGFIQVSPLLCRMGIPLISS